MSWTQSSFWWLSKVHGANIAFVDGPMIVSKGDLDQSAVDEVINSVQRRMLGRKQTPNIS